MLDQITKKEQWQDILKISTNLLQDFLIMKVVIPGIQRQDYLIRKILIECLMIFFTIRQTMIFSLVKKMLKRIRYHYSAKQLSRNQKISQISMSKIWPLICLSSIMCSTLSKEVTIHIWNIRNNQLSLKWVLSTKTFTQPNK